MAEPDADAPAAGLPCGSCGFQNPPGRLYCSDCGAKLAVAPPSYLAAPPATADPAPVARTETNSPASKKPRILTAQRHNPLLDYAKTALRLLILAAIIALVVQLFRAPANLPPPATKMDLATISEIRARLADVTRRGSTADAPWPRLNAYLASVLDPANSPGAMSGSFVRAVVQPCPGGFTLTTERTLARIPLYIAVDYRIVAIDGHLALQVNRVRLGQIVLPKWTAPAAQTFAGDISVPLQADLEFLREAKTVRLSPTDVHLDFGAPRR